MNAASNSQVFDKINQEHDALRDKLRSIHSIMAGPIAADEIAGLLHEFQSALAVHFSNEEESEGFFAEVTAYAPHLAHHAGRLCVKHEELVVKADELCQFAAAGSPSMPWWRELSSRYHEFSKQLMQHESEENKLLQQAHQQDIGAHD